MIPNFMYFVFKFLFVILIFLEVITSSLLAQSTTGISLGPWGNLFPSIQVQSETYGLRSNQATNRNQPGMNIFASLETPYKIYLYEQIRQTASDKNASGAHYKYENCLAPGFKDVLGSILIDISYQSCMHERGPGNNDNSYYQGRIQYGFDENLAFYFYAYLDDTGSQKTNINSINYEYYKYGINPGVNYNFGFFIGNFDYLRLNNYSKTFSLGVSKDLFGIKFDLSAHRTMLDKWVTWQQSDVDGRTFLVLTTTKSF